VTLYGQDNLAIYISIYTYSFHLVFSSYAMIEFTTSTYTCHLSAMSVSLGPGHRTVNMTLTPRGH